MSRKIRRDRSAPVADVFRVIEQERKRLGYSFRELAVRAGELDHVLVYRLLSGTTRLADPRDIDALLKAVGLEADYFERKKSA
jgi:transcriptional regulator with XRE-family HTH domain